MSEAPERTALYRLYDAEARLLYVGITNQPNVRWQQHAREKAYAWWPNVASKSLEWFESRSEAERAEVAAIQSEGPAYNWKNALSFDAPGATRPAGAPSDEVRKTLRDEFERGAQFQKQSRNEKISVGEMVAQMLRKDIAAGRYPVGSQLPVGGALRREFGIGRLAVTQGIALLKAEGLLEYRPGSGTFVVGTP